MFARYLLGVAAVANFIAAAVNQDGATAHAVAGAFFVIAWGVAIVRAGNREVDALVEDTLGPDKDEK
jgi:hypothetical protein